MASWSPLIAWAVSSMTPGLAARNSSPSFSRSARAMIQSPSAAAVEGDDLPHVRELALAGLELGELVVVLGEDDLALGVREDVGRVLLVGARVDRGGRGARTHDPEVGEDPLVARARGDADALLGLDAEGEQAGRHLGHLVARLLPGHRLPGLAHRVAEGLQLRRLLHPLEELDGDVRRQALDKAGVRVRHGWPFLRSSQVSVRHQVTTGPRGSATPWGRHRW